MNRTERILIAADRLARAHHGKDASLKRHPGIGENETEEGRLDWRRALAEFDSAIVELVGAVESEDRVKCSHCDGVGRVIVARATESESDSGGSNG